MRWLAISCVLLASCGAKPVEQGEWSQMSDYPPDGYTVFGSGVTWATDFDITPGIGSITAAALASNTRFTTAAAHGLVAGQYVRIQGTTYYDGEHTVSSVSDTTHFDISETFQGDDTGTFYTNFCGEDSVRFNNTTPAGNLFYTYDTSIAIESGRPYRLSALVQASSIAAGSNVFVYVNWFDADDAFLSQTVIKGSVLSAAGSWERYSSIITPPVGAAGVRPAVGKDNNAFYVWLDDIALEEMPIAFSAYLDSSTTNGGVGGTIVFDGENYDFGDNYSTSTGRFTAPAAGIYSFSAAANIQGLSQDDSVLLLMRLNGSTKIREGQWTYVSPAAGGSPTVEINATLYLDLGDTLEIGMEHSYGSSRTITGGTGQLYLTRFSGALVE